MISAHFLTEKAAARLMNQPVRYLEQR
jgi:hypothetical protein